MKKIIIFGFSLLAGLNTFAQEKKIPFDKKFTYATRMELKENTPEDYDIANLFTSSASKDALFESNSSFVNTSNYSIFSDGRYVRLGGISLDRKVQSYPDTYYTAFEDMQKFEESSKQNITFLKTERQASSYKFPCDYYIIDLSTSNQKYSLLEDSSICFCIDTNNKNKNLRKILPGANIDGLIVAITDLNSEDRAVFLKEIQNVNIEIAYDFENEYQKLKDQYEERNVNYDDYYGVAADSAAVASYDSDYYDDYYNDPLCKYYSYLENMEYKNTYFLNMILSLGCSMKNADFEYDGKIDMTRDQAIRIVEKSTKAGLKQLKKEKIYSKSEMKEMEKAFKTFITEAKAYKPKETKSVEEELSEVETIDMTDYAEAVAAYDYTDGYFPYQSVYKDLQITNNISLAAEDTIYQNSESVKNNMPSYCSALKESIPDFEDKDLYNHVYNSVGQICDLYLYQNGGSVDYFGTLNSLRKSLLEIENKREKMSKKDSLLLKKFINSLD